MWHTSAISLPELRGMMLHTMKTTAHYMMEVRDFLHRRSEDVDLMKIELNFVLILPFNTKKLIKFS